MEPNTNGQKKTGPMIATIIIVVILIVAAILLFSSRIDKNTTGETVAPITNTSDDIQDISEDLNKATQGLDNQNF